MKFNRYVKCFGSSLLLPRFLYTTVLSQSLRIMRLTLFLIAVFSLQVSANVLGQRVSLDIRQQHLTQVLQELRKQTGYAFVYKDSDVANIGLFTLKVYDKDLMEVLPLLSAKLPLQFDVKDKVINVIRQAADKNASKVLEASNHEVIQQYIISGLVVNTDGKPLVGASVSMLDKKGKAIGLQTKTGNQGEFIYKTNTNISIGQVEISHLGYKTLVVPVKDDLGIIVLHANHAELDEVVVPISTGYQRIKPEQSTGAIAQMSTKEFESRISTNFLDGLVNRLPGLMINNNVNFTSENPNGESSSRPLFNIRGISTMSANQSPLIVIDGYPTELSLEMIDPNEIKSVTILKDAAAATVYGVRASNGVIVIERKQAAQGKARFAFRATEGITPQENYKRYRWSDNASGIVTDYQRELLSKTVNSGSWGQLLTGTGGSIRRSPVYYVLAQQAAGMITDEQAERAFQEMKNYDNIDEYQRLFTRSAVSQTYNFNMSGGSERALYYITTNYTNNRSEKKGNDDNRFLLSARSTMRLADRLSLELTLDYQEQRNNNVPVPSVNGVNPSERYQNPDGTPAYLVGSSISPYFNEYLMSQGLDDNLYYPLVDFRSIEDKSKTVNNRITANFVYNLGRGFDLSFGGIYETSRTDDRYMGNDRSSVARNYVNSYVFQNPDGTLKYGVPKGGFLKQGTGSVSGYTVRTQLNYNKVLAQDHSFNGIIGAEVRKLVSTGNTASYFGYNDETLLHQPIDFASISTAAIRGSFQLGSPFHNQFDSWFNQRHVDDRFISGYGNLVYSYKNTYSLTGSVRVDQSNLFGTNPKYKYKPLWSLGGAWNIHKETFMHDLLWLQELKLRVAYGFNGNVAKMSLPEVIATTRLNTYTSPLSPSLRVLSYANSSLRWEQTSNLNFGVDYRIGKNIAGNIDVYKKNGVDLMGKTFIDPTIGTSPSLINQASINNQGIEVGIRADWIARPDFNWNTGIVVARNTSKVRDIYQRTDFNPATLNSVGYVKGYPVGAMFAFRYAGLDNEGYPLIKDEKDDLYRTNDNRTGSPTNISNLMASDTSGMSYYMGSSIPTRNAGLSNRVDFGKFYVFCMINYYGGFKVRVPQPNPSSLRPLEGSDQYWKQAGDEHRTDVMSLAAFSGRNSNDAYNYADRYVVNGDYITLADLTLSYRIDHLPVIKRAGFSNFEIKGQASNIWTVGFNKYNYSMATGSYQKPYLTPTYTLGVFTNF